MKLKYYNYLSNINSLTFNFEIQALIVRANGISGPFKYSLVGEYLTVYVLSLNKTLGCFPSIKKYFSTGLFINTKLHTSRTTPTPLNLFLMCPTDKTCFDFVQVCLLSNPQPLTVFPKGCARTLTRDWRGARPRPPSAEAPASDVSDPPVMGSRASAGEFLPNQ